MGLDVHSMLSGRYEIGSVLGRGAGSEVRRAFDRRLRRTVAIKFVDPKVWPSARFQAEARLAAAVPHRNIVTVFDVGIEEVPFVVMECLPGTTLADEIRRGPLTDERASQVMNELLDALGAAHVQGVLHRDIKPTNLLLTADAHVKLSDFGIATSPDARHLTETGMVIGTPMYLAPERLRGEPATVRSDLYAAGVVLYEALTGRPPFRGDSPLAVAYAVNHADVDAPPGALGPVAMRAMSRDPDGRYASAADMADALHATPDDATKPFVIPATRVMPVPAGAATTQRTRRRRGRRGAVILVALAAIFLASLQIGLLVRSSHDSTPSTPASTDTRPLPPALAGPFRELEHSVQP
jgi:serine/threonine protein kinase